MAGSGIFNRRVIPSDGSAPLEADSDDDASKGEQQEPAKRKSDHLFKGIYTPEGKQRRYVGKEWQVALISVKVGRSGIELCNGQYRYNGLHQGKPLFKTESGAIIYFNKFWKMNYCYKTAGWVYSLPDATGPLPPEGKWTQVSSLPRTTPGVPPEVKLLDDQPCRRLGEQGAQLLLEGNRKVNKREEGKLWRWVEVDVYEDVEVKRAPEPEATEQHSGSPGGAGYRWKKSDPPPAPERPHEEECAGCSKMIVYPAPRKTCGKCDFAFHPACIRDPLRHECVKVPEQPRCYASESVHRMFAYMEALQSTEDEVADLDAGQNQDGYSDKADEAKDDWVYVESPQGKQPGAADLGSMGL
eukprot:TRINITY_DN16699_c0_g1_i1.p1 TRINITY_DN16699_c0_g1~~TRINITY_DN16699_c0_g1_i1.p1  ORF type:complete len:356 (+),score=63.74 TRINITY_DN16699_c0_g1_i1:84-1151(+)